MTIQQLAKCCTQAVQHPRVAVQQLLASETGAAAAMALMDAALWTDTDIASYEDRAGAVLISGRWGTLWLASATCTKVLLPPAPRIDPRALRTLALGIVDYLNTGGNA